MPGGQFLQLDVPDTGDGVAFDDQLVAIGCRGADVGLGVELIPGPQPGGHGVVLRAGYIDTLDLQVKWKNGFPVSAKGKGGGIGLLNVQSSVKKYDGNLILKSDGNKFIAELFLNS